MFTVKQSYGLFDAGFFLETVFKLGRY